MAFVGVPFRISWDANTEPDLAGYKVYFGPRSGVYTGAGSPIDVGNVTTYLLTVNTAGQTFIVVTAYNATAQESTASNEIEMDVYVPLARGQASRGVFRMPYR